MSEPNFLMDYFNQVLLLDAFKAFLHSSIVDEALFSRQKRCMSVNNECRSSYNGVGIFCYQFEPGEIIFFNDDGSAHEVSYTNPTPKCAVNNGTE